MGPIQGDIYAQSGLSLRTGCPSPLHAGDEQGHSAAADLVLGLLAILVSWPWGFLPGLALQVSDAGWLLHAPVGLQIFLASVCYSYGGG